MRGQKIQIHVINRFMVSAQEEAENDTALNLNGAYSIRKGAVRDRGRDNVSSMGALSVNNLRMTIPLLPNYLPTVVWDALEDKAGFFTLRQGDVIIMNNRKWVIRGITDNTGMPRGSHFVIDCVDGSEDIDNGF